MNSGSGTLITDSNSVGGGGYLVLSIAGTFNTFNITGLASTNDFLDNDNLVFPGNVHLLDTSGLAFITEVSPEDSETWNLFFNAGTYQSAKDGDLEAGDLGAFTLSLVPEPSAYVLFGIGTLVTGVLYRRRNRLRSQNKEKSLVKPDY